MRAFRRLIDHALRAGRKLGAVEAESAAERRVFDLYAVGDDRFLIQRGGRAATKERRRSLVLARRADLRAGRRGMLCALSTGHFGTVLTPLFSGALGDLCRVPRGRRSETLARRVALANVASRAVELLQRDEGWGDDWRQNLQKRHFQRYLDGIRDSLFEQFESLGAYSGAWTSKTIHRPVEGGGAE